MTMTAAFYVENIECAAKNIASSSKSRRSRTGYKNKSKSFA
jgi:hypothetical protein